MVSTVFPSLSGARKELALVMATACWAPVERVLTRCSLVPKRLPVEFTVFAYFASSPVGVFLAIHEL